MSDKIIATYGVSVVIRDNGPKATPSNERLAEVIETAVRDLLASTGQYPNATVNATATRTDR